MKRLSLLLWVGAAFLQASVAFGQPAPKVPRLCLLTFDPASSGWSRYTPFFDRLRELGYVDGRSLVVNWLSANGRSDAFPDLASQCVRDNADVIVVGTTPAAEAAKRATGTIPIVMLPLGDPVGTGLVTSLARPGGNVTGTTTLAPLMIAKGLELLKEAVPGVSRVLVFTYPRDPISRGQVSALHAAAKSLGVELLVHDIDGPTDFPPGFEEGRKAGVDGVITTVESIFFVNRAQIIDLARSHALPAVFSEEFFVTEGGLMSYDADRQVLGVHSANYVDQVLKGVKPGDLPIEQPAVFTIAVNLRTARALGIAIPPSILARADKVIE
jgi:putative ABC transport system substrate-binding protein